MMQADEAGTLSRLIALTVLKKRLSLLSNDHVRYELKTPYRDCTTQVIFEPMDFIARLVALVPKPRSTSLDSTKGSRRTERIVRSDGGQAQEE